MFNTVDDDTSNFFMVAICRPGLIGGAAAVSHHTSTAQTHTHHPSRQEEKFRQSGDKQRETKATAKQNPT
jgi:hypothetical protein